jgi:hypothetical protein
MGRWPSIIALIMAASLSIAVVALQQRGRSPRCALDGSPIQPLYEVVIIKENGKAHPFSCVLSARIWLAENRAPVSSIWVTDEGTGKRVRAESAFYVESKVMTTPHTGNRIHVFAQREAAETHARLFGGRFVVNPLRSPEKGGIRFARYGKHSGNAPDFWFPPSQKPLCLASEAVSAKARGCGPSPIEGAYGLLNGFSQPPERPPKAAA